MELTSENVRRRALKMANECKRNTHLGGALSMVELLTVLYRDVMNYDFNNPEWEQRDRFILSKGHCALTLDAIMVEAGVISEEDSKTYLQDGSAYGAHPVMNIAHGIESSSGSLGQGISMAVGLAKAAKIKGENHKIYTLIGNGECDEGSVWEAVMLASQWKLDNLTVILDDNKLQGDGYSADIIDMSNVDERFKSFGFKVVSVDGHDEKAIKEAFEMESDGKPKVIIGHTVKGKGVSFIEDNNAWHHNRLTDEMYGKAMEELGGMR